MPCPTHKHAQAETFANTRAQPHARMHEHTDTHAAVHARAARKETSAKGEGGGGGRAPGSREGAQKAGPHRGGILSSSGGGGRRGGRGRGRGRPAGAAGRRCGGSLPCRAPPLGLCLLGRSLPRLRCALIDLHPFSKLNPLACTHPWWQVTRLYSHRADNLRDPPGFQNEPDRAPRSEGLCIRLGGRVRVRRGGGTARSIGRYQKYSPSKMSKQ